MRESRHWPCYCSFSYKYKLQNDENFQWQYCGEYCCIASSIGIVLNDRICEKSQINVRPVIALFRATIHLSLVQSVLESLLLLGMIGDVEQSKVIFAGFEWKIIRRIQTWLRFKKKNLGRIAKAAWHNFTGKCSLDCNDVFPVCPVRPLYPVSGIFLLMISYYLLAY